MKKVAVVVCALWLAGAARAQDKNEAAPRPSVPQKEIATFAGGCFWCMEPPFRNADGVESVKSGYTGGTKPNPTYDEVCSGKTGHVEAIQVTYNPTRISYEQLLEIFWRNIDPTTENQQFSDVGTQYRTAIFYHNEEQKRLAEVSKEKLSASGKFTRPIVTQIVPAAPFYVAEEYHQDFYQKNPLRYKTYRTGSGRAAFLERTWGEPSEEKKEP